MDKLNEKCLQCGHPRHCGVGIDAKNYRRNTISRTTKEEEAEFIRGLRPDQKQYTEVPQEEWISWSKEKNVDGICYYTDDSRCICWYNLISILTHKKHIWIEDTKNTYAYMQKCLRCGKMRT